MPEPKTSCIHKTKIRHPSIKKTKTILKTKTSIKKKKKSLKKKKDGHIELNCWFDNLIFFRMIIQSTRGFIYLFFVTNTLVT